MLVVAVGSKNPAKTRGTGNVFRRFFSSVEVRSVEAPSGVGPQPFGLENILLGAANRARHSLRETSADFGVGIEAGLHSLGESHVNLQLAVVMDPKGRYTVGSSAGFMIPGGYAGKMRAAAGAVELDAFARELTGARNVEEEHGVVYGLTMKRVSRLEMTEQCVTMALVPWLNKKLYGL